MKRSNRIGAAFLCFGMFGGAVLWFSDASVRGVLFGLCGLLAAIVMGYVAVRGRYPTHWFPGQRRFERELDEMFSARTPEAQARLDAEYEQRRSEAQKIKVYTIDGVAFARIPLGQEQDWEEGSDFCSDCFVKLGQLHIPGCDMEECPKSHAQAITSPHRIAELRERSAGN